MDLRTQLEEDLKKAMKASDDLGKRTLRMVLASVKLAEVEKGARLDDPAMVAIFQKEIKSRREAIADANKANRPELAASSQEEIGVLEHYLPKAMTEEELKGLVATVMSELNATTPADMGKVIKAVMARAQGRAAGDQISKAVRELLQK